MPAPWAAGSWSGSTPDHAPRAEPSCVPGQRQACGQCASPLSLSDTSLLATWPGSGCAPGPPHASAVGSASAEPGHPQPHPHSDRRRVAAPVGVPLVVAALVLVRGLPALLTAHDWAPATRSPQHCCRRRHFPFIVAAVAIGHSTVRTSPASPRSRETDTVSHQRSMNAAVLASYGGPKYAGSPVPIAHLAAQEWSATARMAMSTER